MTYEHTIYKVRSLCTATAVETVTRTVTHHAYHTETPPPEIKWFTRTLHETTLTLPAHTIYVPFPKEFKNEVERNTSVLNLVLVVLFLYLIAAGPFAAKNRSKAKTRTD